MNSACFASGRLGVRSLWILSALTALSVTAVAQARLEFDVVSIKPNASGTIGFRIQDLRNGRAAMTNVTVRSLLFRAFDISADTPIDGLPAWVDAEHYDVEVRTSGMPSTAEQREMWRTLLVDRLKLATHDDTREQSIYSMVVARPDKGPGPGLMPATVSCPERELPPDAVVFARNAERVFAAAPPSPKAAERSAALTPEFIAQRLTTCGNYTGNGTILSASMTMAALAKYLTERTERLVVDKTGLQGAFAVRMVAAPDDNGSLFTTIQEQLGLKLESARARARVLVIDHIEKPTEN